MQGFRQQYGIMENIHLAVDLSSGLASDRSRFETDPGALVH